MTRPRYAGLDFSTVFDEVVGHLQAVYGADFSALAVTDLVTVLVDLFAYSTDGLGFYLDDRVGELLGATVRTPLAAQLLLRLWGYRRRGAVPASTDVLLSIPDVQVTGVPIPAGTLLQGPGAVVFQTVQPVSFLVGETGGGTQLRVSVTQSETVTETFTSSGQPWQVVGLRRMREGEFVVSRSVQVSVNGTAYAPVDFLRLGMVSSFEVEEVGDPARVRFGSARAGSVPPAGATMRVTYRVTRGLAGRVDPGTITALVSPLVVAGQTVDVSIEHPERATAGEDPESLEDALLTAPRLFKARNVAVTTGDYLALAERFSDPVGGRVAAADAFVARSADTDAVLQVESARIRAQLAAVSASVQAALTTLGEGETLAVQALGAVDDELTLAVSTLTTLQADLTAARVAATGLLTHAATVAGGATAAQTQVSALSTTIGAIATGGSDALTTGTRDTLVNTLTGIAAKITALSGANTSLQAGATTLAGDLEDLVTVVRDTVGTDRTAGIDTILGRLGTAYLAQVDTVTAVSNGADAVEAAVVAPLTGMVAAVELSLDALAEHFDAVLADEAAANVVSVPILARDSAGFYAAPSVALCRALQTFLEARCDETHVVCVTSGEGALVPVVCTVVLHVPEGVDLLTTERIGLASLRALLRPRKFGQGLYLSELLEVGAPGVVHSNATIAGHLERGATVTTYLDTHGNMVIPRGKVITAGTLAVTAVRWTGRP